jgi:hypothetical protein
VYDVQDCDKDVICNVIKKSTTRSVINVDPDLVDSIPENDHLLYIGSDGGHQPAFIQRNLDRWWGQQTSNSSTFYFSPQWLFSEYVFSFQATIAHIFISLITPSRLRLRLLHRRFNETTVSIQEDSNELHHISADEIPEELRLQDFELEQFEPGRHELELVVTPSGEYGHYRLRDILVEFFNNPPPHSSVDKNVATMVEHGGADAEPVGIRDLEEDGNANVFPPPSKTT